MNPQPLTGQNWTEAQRQFLASLEKAGANKPEYAVPIDKAPPLPVRELQALLDAGVVREASSNGYYLYPRQISAPVGESVESPVVSGLFSRRATAPRRQFTWRRLIATLVFWIIVILIPILLMKFTAR